MEDGEDVKNQQQLFVAKMTEDNLKRKQKRIRRETKRNQQPSIHKINNSLKHSLKFKLITCDKKNHKSLNYESKPKHKN